MLKKQIEEMDERLALLEKLVENMDTVQALLGKLVENMDTVQARGGIAARSYANCINELQRAVREIHRRLGISESSWRAQEQSLTDSQ